MIVRMPRGGGTMGRRRPLRSHLMLAFVCALALVATGCGSRLSEQEREQAISALTGGGGGGGGTTTNGTTTSGGGGGTTETETTGGGGGGGGGGEETGGGGGG